MGKYLTIPRTDGISTTDIVGRILLMTKSHHSIKTNQDHTNINNHKHQHHQQHDDDDADDVGDGHHNDNNDDRRDIHHHDGDDGVILNVNNNNCTDVSNNKIRNNCNDYYVSGCNTSTSTSSKRLTTARSFSEPLASKSRFLTTSRTIRLFGAGQIHTIIASINVITSIIIIIIIISIYCNRCQSSKSYRSSCILGW